jgi:hypothetical protein
MILKDESMTLPVQHYSPVHARGLVARILLDNIGDNTAERHRLTQRDIAILAGIDWEAVHNSFKSLQDEGAIRIERHHMIINKALLQKVTQLN